MTTVIPRGFLSKKEIEASYGRSYRSLTRDITRAVKAADFNILRHLKLITEDDAIREGTEVNLDMIQDLSNQGLRPMWLAEESWVADWCSQRPGHRRSATTNDQHAFRSTPSPTTEVPVVSDPDQPATVEMLQQRVEDQRQHIETLRGELQIKNEQIRNANQLAEQNQELMRNLQVLLKNVQDGLLGEGSRRLIAGRATASKPTEAIPHAPLPENISVSACQPRRTAKPASRKRTKKRTTAKNSATVTPASARIERRFPTLFRRKRPAK